MSWYLATRPWLGNEGPHHAKWYNHANCLQCRRRPFPILSDTEVWGTFKLNSALCWQILRTFIAMGSRPSQDPKGKKWYVFAQNKKTPFSPKHHNLWSALHPPAQQLFGQRMRYITSSVLYQTIRSGELVSALYAIEVSGEVSTASPVWWLMELEKHWVLTLIYLDDWTVEYNNSYSAYQ